MQGVARKLLWVGPNIAELLQYLCLMTIDSSIIELCTMNFMYVVGDINAGRHYTITSQEWKGSRTTVSVLGRVDHF